MRKITGGRDEDYFDLWVLDFRDPHQRALGLLAASLVGVLVLLLIALGALFLHQLAV